MKELGAALGTLGAGLSQSDPIKAHLKQLSMFSCCGTHQAAPLQLIQHLFFFFMGIIIIFKLKHFIFSFPKLDHLSPR